MVALFTTGARDTFEEVAGWTVEAEVAGRTRADEVVAVNGARERIGTRGTAFATDGARTDSAVAVSRKVVVVRAETGGARGGAADCARGRVMGTVAIFFRARTGACVGSLRATGGLRVNGVSSSV